MKKFNKLDGDRAADVYDEVQGNKRVAKIFNAFCLGSEDRLNGKSYNNKFKKPFERLAYKNGFYGTKTG